jgi:hypothetical protein
MTDRLNLLSRHREQLERLLRQHVPETEVWAYGGGVNSERHEACVKALALRRPRKAGL